MSTPSQQFPSFSPIVDIPDDIYRPLLIIAQRGYEAEDVLQYYLAIQHQLSQLHPTTAVSPYSLTPPVSACSPRTVEPDTTVLRYRDSSSPMYHALSSAQIETPHVEQGFWSSDNIYRATGYEHSVPSPSISGLDPEPSSAAHWIPSAPITSGLQLVGNVVDVGDFLDEDVRQDPQSVRRPSQPILDTPDGSSRKRKASDSSPYEIAMSSTAMPILVPTTLPCSNSGMPYVPFMTMPGYANLPEISVIPSRKRAKATPKGVKTIRRPVNIRQPSI